MSILTITVLSQVDAEKHPPRRCEAIISITDPGAPPAELHPGWPAILRIEFGDLEYDRHTIAYWGASWQSVEGVFRAAHAQDIIRFVERVESDPDIDHLVIHCHAGKSRSAAIATWVAARHAIPPALSWSGRNQTVLDVLEEPARYEWAWASTRPRWWQRIAESLAGFFR